jgi:hypothetical protein
VSFSLSQSMAGTYSTPMGFLQEHGPPDTDFPRPKTCGRAGYCSPSGGDTGWATGTATNIDASFTATVTTLLAEMVAST